MAKFADHMEKISDGVVEGYKKIEDAFVNTSMAKEASRQMPACSVDTVNAAAPLT